MNEYTPDRWVVLNMSENENESIQKVFAGWYGGYLGSDSWKLSSGIIEVKENDGTFEFVNVSSSVYRCRRGAYGMTGLMCDVFENWQQKLLKMQEGSIEIAAEYRQE